MKTSTVVIMGLGAVAVLYLINKQSAAAPVVYRPPVAPVPSSAATTAAEIAAGSTVATSLISDLFGNSSNSGTLAAGSMDDVYGNMSLSGVYNDGEN